MPAPAEPFPTTGRYVLVLEPLMWYKSSFCRCLRLSILVVFLGNADESAVTSIREFEFGRIFGWGAGPPLPSFPTFRASRSGAIGLFRVWVCFLFFLIFFGLGCGFFFLFFFLVGFCVLFQAEHLPTIRS